MSQQDVWVVFGRAKVDSSATQLLPDFNGALKAKGYTLTPDEVQIARASGSSSVNPNQQFPGLDPERQGAWKLRQKKMSRRIKSQSDRRIGLSTFIVKTLQDTIRHATRQTAEFLHRYLGHAKDWQVMPSDDAKKGAGPTCRIVIPEILRRKSFCKG